MSTETETEYEELAREDRGDPSRTHPAEHIFRCKHHLVSPTRDARDLIRFEYWSKHCDMLVPGEFVWCEPADRSWWVLLRVLDVCGEGMVVEPIFGNKTFRYQPPAPERGPHGTNADDFTYERSDEFVDKWAVVRINADGAKQVMTKGQPLSYSQCEDWLKRHLVTVRRK